MAISITPSPFGSVTVTLDGELGGVLSVSVLATSNSALDMALGTPGPAGEAGEPGANGVGVAAGGLINQVLVKLSNDDFDTGWANSGAGGDYLPLSGGTMSGTIFLPSLRNLLNTDLTVTAYNDTGAGTNFIHTFDAFDGTFALATNGGGLKFPDATVQVTSALPLTGGTVSGQLEITNGTNFIRLAPDEGIAELSGINLSLLSGSQITFPDTTIQYTAFPPSGGLVTEYITGTGTLVTFPEVGDRYLTTSTTSLLIGNGTKTLTIGTGLSYTTQQDVTIAYDASNHMHATVTSYNSGTGVMVAQVHKHTGSGTFAAWTVNVGGVVGGLYLAIDNNLSELTATASTARTNLGLGTMSTEPATAYLSTASAVANYLTISSASSTYQTQAGMSAYLSTSAAASTYQTQAGMSAYLSTSAAASTYQTQSGMSAYLSTASASANFIGTSAYATTAQAQAGTSTTTVVNPSTLLDAKFFAGYKPLSLIYTWTSAISGAGAFTTVSGLVKIVSGPTALTGYAQAIILNNNASRGQQYTSGADFTKRTTIGGRFVKTVTTADANSVFRFLLGKITPSTPAGDLSVRGIGFRQVANGALELQVHNGTSIFNVTSSFTPTANQAYDVVIVADAGTATMYVNGSSVATSANAPTALLGANTGVLEIEAQNTSSLSGSAMQYVGSDMFVQTNL